MEQSMGRNRVLINTVAGVLSTGQTKDVKLYLQERRTKSGSKQLVLGIVSI